MVGIVVAAFNQEKAVISRLVILYNFKLREGSFQALVARPWQVRGSRGHQVEQRLAGASRRLSLVREHEPWHARTHAHYDRDQPRVPFNTPEAATSSSSADSSPELPRRKGNRAINEPSRNFTVPGEGIYQGLLLVESVY